MTVLFRSVARVGAHTGNINIKSVVLDTDIMGNAQGSFELAGRLVSATQNIARR